jgi:hypothetical protein
VLARFRDARLSRVLGAADLDRLGGSVDAFATALRAELTSRGWSLPPAIGDAAEVS